VWTREKIETIKKLMVHTQEHFIRESPKIYSYEILSLIFEQPYCRIQNITDAGLSKRHAASRYLKELVRIGVLTELQVGREKVFIHPKLIKVLTRETNTFEKYSI
jgi:Fic family protein